MGLDAAASSFRTPGAHVLRPFVARDRRGDFCKVFDIEVFARHGLETRFEETFVTTSARDVIRGMHLQLPPHDHVKCVTCLQGRILDVIVDLREGSPMAGQHESIELAGSDPRTVYVPPGVAHGFCVLEGPAIVHYATSTRHAPSHDTGIRWDTFGMRWPVTQPIVSERDAALPTLAEFRSPFRFEGPR
jgi:dTDP-4-dehydrorhamnose 3,5-epimerase